MIYPELLRYFTKNLSSTEIDTCLYALTKMDWDNNVHTSLEELAYAVGTTKKYMRDIIKRLTEKDGKKVFKKVEDESAFLQFTTYQGSLEFDPRIDRYGKKYRFLYTDEFKQISLNAKRMLLIAAYEMSVSKSEKVTIPLNRFIKNTDYVGSLPLSRKQLFYTLKEINLEMKNIVAVGITSNTFTKEEEVSFVFTKGTLEQYIDNNVEAFVLRRKLYLNGLHEYVPEYVITGIQKVAKHLFKSLTNEEKQYGKRHAFDEDRRITVSKLARSIYDASIIRFATAYKNKKRELTTTDVVSAYFSSIVHDVTKEELAKAVNQKENISKLLNTINTFRVHNMYDSEQYEEISIRKKIYQDIEFILLKVCENWIVSRMKSIFFGKNKKSRGDNKKQKQSIYDLRDIVFEERKKLDSFYNKLESIGLIHFNSVRDAFNHYLINLEYKMETIHKVV